MNGIPNEQSVPSESVLQGNLIEHLVGLVELVAFTVEIDDL